MRNGTVAFHLAGIFFLTVMTGFSGCGGQPGEEGNNLFDSFQADMEAMSNRSASHYTFLTGILSASDDGTGGNGAVVAGDIPAIVTSGKVPSDWVVVKEEMDAYGEDMHRHLNRLGDQAAMIGACRMMMGGGFSDPVGAVETCSFRPYWKGAKEEIRRHLQEMRTGVDREDAPGLMREMDIHLDSLEFHLREMSLHMEDLHGTHGRMMDMG